MLEGGYRMENHINSPCRNCGSKEFDRHPEMVGVETITEDYIVEASPGVALRAFFYWCRNCGEIRLFHPVGGSVR